MIFRVRSMVAADLDRVVEITAALKDAPQWPRRVFEAVLAPATPMRIALIAEDSVARVVMGFVVAAVVPPEAELESIAVSAGYQRQGVARRLFGVMADELVRAQVRELLLEVRESNQAARGFYAALGFMEEGRRRSYYADPVEDAVLMRTQLVDPSSPSQA